MDSRRLYKNQDTGYQQRPKIVLTGRLDGLLQGRSVRIIAAENSVRLELDSLLSLWSLYGLRKTIRPLQKILAGTGCQSEIFYKSFCLFRQSGRAVDYQ